MNNRATSAARLILAVAILFLVAGCGKAPKETAQKPAPAPTGSGMPPNHPPMGGAPMMKDLEGPLDDNPLPLRQAGLSSAAELTRDRVGLADAALQQNYEQAYRLSFCARMNQRDYTQAVDLAGKVVAARPDFAPAYRVLGYALFNTGRAEESLTAYKKALELNPNYGEVHYALAFLYAQGDLITGREHFQKAMDLGIPDERSLGTRFYPPTR